MKSLQIWASGGPWELIPPRKTGETRRISREFRGFQLAPTAGGAQNIAVASTCMRVTKGWRFAPCRGPSLDGRGAQQLGARGAGQALLGGGVRAGLALQGSLEEAAMEMISHVNEIYNIYNKSLLIYGIYTYRDNILNK